MENKYSKALKEVYYILKISSQEEIEKIPEEIIELIKENMDKDYEPKIDFEENFEKSVLEETLVILALLYRDYLASAEEREKLLSQEKIEIEKQREKYSIDNIFKNQKITKESNDNVENKIIESKKEKWYENIINKIKNMLNKR